MSAWQSAPKGSNVVTVPQFTPLWRLRGLVRGTQGSWNLWGDDVGVRLVAWSRRGLPLLEDGWEGLLRPGRRRSESERAGGGGGRLDLRREMLRVEDRECKEEALCFRLSRFSAGEQVRFSEHTESPSARQGVERPEDSSGSQFHPSAETQLRSCVMLVQSLPVWLLWMLELGERDL